MKKYTFLFLSTLFFVCFLPPTDGIAQIKIKKPRIDLDKEGGKVLDKVFGKDKKEEEEEAIQDQQDPDGPIKGRKLTPPDVNNHLANAETSLSASQYAAVRYELRQALLGVELEIGYQILAMLPEAVSGMAFQPDNDQVMSDGTGFVGLAIAREYGDHRKGVSAGLFNNAALMSFYSGMLAGANYASSEGESKTVNVQGYRGALTFDGESEYELGIPIGQSTLFRMTCTGFADENEVMQAVEVFPLKEIGQKLGEQ